MTTKGKTQLQMDPELQNILYERGPSPLFLPVVENIEIFRKRWAAGTARFAASTVVREALLAAGTCNESNFDIPVRDGSRIAVRTYTPKSGAKDRFPLFIMIHGGGFCLGGLDTEEVICRLLCTKLKLVVLNIAYRLAPEHPFPTGWHDSIDAAIWASKNSSKLEVNLEKAFIVGGVSGGATVAAAIAHKWRIDQLSPQITGVFLSNPILDNETLLEGKKIEVFEDAYNSKRENAQAPVLNQELSDRFWSICKPDRRSPLYSPLLFESFAHQPKTYLQICSLDPYRDGSLIYEKLLRETGVETRFNLYTGLPHSFWSMFPSLGATRRWLTDTIVGAEWLLGQLQHSSKSSRL